VSNEKKGLTNRGVGGGWGCCAEAKGSHNGGSLGDLGGTTVGFRREETKKGETLSTDGKMTATYQEFTEKTPWLGSLQGYRQSKSLVEKTGDTFEEGKK